MASALDKTKYEIQRQLATKELMAFTKWTNPLYKDAWHHRLVAKYIDYLIDGSINRLMVTMPPRGGKTELSSVRLPAYYLGKFPDNQILACSYSADLANTNSRAVQSVIPTPKYAELFPETRLPTGKTRKKLTEEVFQLDGHHRGTYRCAGIGGQATGFGFNLGIIDDPTKNWKEALSASQQDDIWAWYSSTFLTRQALNAKILVTTTRWSTEDLPGRLIGLADSEPGADQWVILRLPAFADDDLHPEDPRLSGQPLWPEGILNETFLQSQLASMGTFQFTGLYQQLPIVAGGNHFKEEWFKGKPRWKDWGTHFQVGMNRFAKGACTIFGTCDPAATEKRTSDHTAMGIWAMTPANDLLALHVQRGRYGVEHISKELLKVSRIFRPEFWAIEADGWQVAVTRAARCTDGMPPIREVYSEGKGKLQKAMPGIILAESGKFILPEDAEWIKPFLNELYKFTGVDDREDDFVDCYSTAATQVPRLYVDLEDPVQVPHMRDDEDRFFEPEEYNSHAGELGMFGRNNRY
jgi:predicted phage terminase large subunit-like protein